MSYCASTNGRDTSTFKESPLGRRGEGSFLNAYGIPVNRLRVCVGVRETYRRGNRFDSRGVRPETCRPWASSMAKQKYRTRGGRGTGHPPVIVLAISRYFFWFWKWGVCFTECFTNAAPTGMPAACRRPQQDTDGIKKPTGRGYQRAYRRGQPDRYRREICIYIPRWATVP